MEFIEYGQTLKKIRKSLGFSRKYVQEYGFVSMETIRKVEEGVSEPRISTLWELSHFYKVNLVSLLNQHRGNRSVFSDQLMKEISALMSNVDFEGLKQVLLETQEDFKSNTNSGLKNKVLFTGLLNAIKNMETRKTKDSDRMIQVLESLLIDLSSHSTLMLHDRYVYPTECFAGQILITYYRRNNKNTDAIRILNRLISALEENPDKSSLNSRLLAVCYFNLAYSYHRFDNHEKVISICDQVLSVQDGSVPQHILSGLLFRKAIAMFKLDKKDFNHYLSAAFVLATADNKKMYCSALSESLGYEHELCQFE